MRWPAAPRWASSCARRAAWPRPRRARYRLAELRYRNGAASYLDLLDAQRALFAAQQAVVQTRLQQLQNQVLLYRVLGGGWTEPAQVASSASR